MANNYNYEQYEFSAPNNYNPLPTEQQCEFYKLSFPHDNIRYPSYQSYQQLTPYQRFNPPPPYPGYSPSPKPSCSAVRAEFTPTPPDTSTTEFTLHVLEPLEIPKESPKPAETPVVYSFDNSKQLNAQLAERTKLQEAKNQYLQQQEKEKGLASKAALVPKRTINVLKAKSGQETIDIPSPFAKPLSEGQDKTLVAIISMISDIIDYATYSQRSLYLEQLRRQTIRQYGKIVVPIIQVRKEANQ